MIRPANDAHSSRAWRRFLLVAVIVIASTAAPTFAVCSQPAPRVCAEFFNRDLVLVGTVTSEEPIPDEEDGFIGGWRYRILVTTTYRGPSMSSVNVMTPNTSIRFPLDVGHEYLLFASRRGDDWMIDCCGVSGRLSESWETIRAIEAVRSGSSGFVYGYVIDRDTWTGIGDVSVTIRGSTRRFSTASGPDGHFQVEVPPGPYSVVIDRDDIEAYDLSYDDPAAFVVHAGGCALVQFVTIQRR